MALLGSDCLNSIVDAALFGSDEAKLLYFVKEAFKLYSNECKRKNLLSILGLNSSLGPFDMMKAFAEDAVSNATAESILNSALDQLGERYIYSQAQNYGAAAIESVMNQSDVKNALETAKNIQKAMFSLTAILLTGGNDIILEFAKTTAKRLLEHVETKRVLITQMRENVRKINNAILLLEVKSFQDEWKLEMLEARNYINLARNNFITVYSFLSRDRGFRNFTYQKGRDNLDEADEILTPKKVDGELSGKMDNQGAIWNGAFSKATGLEVNEEQKNAVMSIPQLALELTGFIDDYTEITEKINPLIRNYINAYGNLQKASGGKLTNWQLETLNFCINTLGDTLEDMDRELTTSQTGIQNVGYSLNSFEWMAEVKTVIASLETMQPEVLEALDQSNEGLVAYNNSVVTLTETDSLSALGGNLVMECPDSQEEYADLITMIGGLLVQAQRIYLSSGPSVINGLSDYTTVTDARLSLSSLLLDIIDEAVRPFTLIESPLKENVNNLTGFLDDMGFDRAKDLIVNGDYDKFFNMTDKTVTWVGAAMTCLRSASSCAESQQVKNEIDDLLLLLNRHEKNQFLEASRVVNSGRRRRINHLLDRIRECEQGQGKADQLSEKEGCDLDKERLSSSSESYQSTKDDTAPGSGFDVATEDRLADQTYDRQEIVDGEVEDFNQFIDLDLLNPGREVDTTKNFFVNFRDRSNELTEINRTIEDIENNLSSPPTDVEIDQLNVNRNLQQSLETHGLKLNQSRGIVEDISGMGVDKYNAVSVTSGRVNAAYMNGAQILEIGRFDPAAKRTNQKVILPGSN